MVVEFDPAKRLVTLEARGLDMARVEEVFDGPSLTTEDDRHDYGETRWITIVRMAGRMVVVVWTSRGEARRIISLRKANDRERDLYGPRLDRS